MSRGESCAKRSWTEEELGELFSGSADVVFQSCSFGDNGDNRALLLYADGLCDSRLISEVVIPELRRQYDSAGSFADVGKALAGVLPVMGEHSELSKEQLCEAIFEGALLLFFRSEGTFCLLEYPQRPSRNPFESSTEISIKGPKDCFIEDLSVNIALIRKRIRSESLRVEKYVIGARTRTKVALLYFHDILNPQIRQEVRRRLESFEVDGLYSIGQIEERLVGSSFKLMPLLAFSGRPDMAVSSLLAGRFVLIVDGNPMVLIGPAGLAFIMKSPEDIHFNYAYVSFARIIRIFSLFLSIFLPAIWVALMAFHQDQIPFRLMATISVARLGLPLSAQMEMFILIMLIEIFREAGIRLPSAIGQTLTSIGGLIIGDSAIRAGLVSPSVVVVGAITAVCSITLVNQSLSTIVSILRLFMFALASFAGMYGVILGIVLLTAYLATQKSFGVSYLSPTSPLSVKDIVQANLKLPWAWMKNRPTVLHPIDKDRQGAEGE
ncbi:spore germination protein [Cohnella fermenti]|uniref:Spore germination protein n=1 Tax=Cohnella fermenti TaxID=2565925 RepID=A0A4S4BXU0_9BACL|nr:spore germination protein [Cohnella fermenti]THF79527.1 spore germination protein [Cohnella fermenti]